MSDRCTAYNEPSDGDCLLRCTLTEGHNGRHSGTFGYFPSEDANRNRVWSDESPHHRRPSGDLATRWPLGDGVEPWQPDTMDVLAEVGLGPLADDTESVASGDTQGGE